MTTILVEEKTILKRRENKKNKKIKLKRDGLMDDVGTYFDFSKSLRKRGFTCKTGPTLYLRYDLTLDGR